MGSRPSLTAIPGGADGHAALPEIAAVTHDYLVPAVAGLSAAVEDGDMDAVRAYAFEVLVGVGSIIAACPHGRDTA